MGCAFRVMTWRPMVGAPAQRRSMMCDPGSGGVDDPLALDVVFLAGYGVAQAHAADAAFVGADGKDGEMVAGDGSGSTGVTQPVGYQALGKFAARVLVGIERPALSGIE